MTGAENLTYVYAVVPDTDRVRSAVEGVRGVSGAAVSLLGEGVPRDAEGVSHEDEEASPEDEAAPPACVPAPPEGEGPASPVAFVISRVASDEFDERTLKARFEDLEWLEDIARAHHEVVQVISHRDTVLPLRLATLYQDDARAREALAAQRQVFAERIALLRDRSEWGVKLYIGAPGPPKGSGADGAGSTGSTDTLSPGKAYLQRRRAQHSVREDRYRNAQEAAQRIDALVARFRTYRVRHPAQHGALAGPEENVLNDAYLVPDDRIESFRAALAAVAADLDGVRVEVTGPWAPYSFAMPPPPPEPARGSGARDGPVR
ncbi:GvpL/GvpF family gas vesicle protein [Streptomyces zaomyceticus]|uniref:GvpL/GvpF family gas vesicle protein n=1 Tax=Streptomyces zaomyceticus TaxID=68286 RepID=UPI00372276B3